MSSRAHCLPTLVLAAVLLLGAIAPADAALRSPRLSAACEAGSSYQEIRLGQWRVEGCAEERDPNAGESRRWRFTGTVELNGMLVEGSEPLFAISETAGENGTHRIKRAGNAKLVLDPLIGGQRRRLVMYSGAVDLAHEGSSQNQVDTGARPPTAPPLARGAVADTGLAVKVDLPVGSGATVLGLRLRDTIRDAVVDAGDGSEVSPGSIEFKADMSLGSSTSSLLRDWVSKVTIETVDGQGMKVTGLKFKIPAVEIEGIGGFRDLKVTYSEERDEWGGGVKLDLGELMPTFDFEMKVSASTGAPTSIVAEVDNMNIPIGQSGVVLQGARGAFNNNPLIMSAGLTATAGPQVAGVALIEMSGDLTIQLEPGFRLEAEGLTRVLPTGAESQLATGTMSLILDSDGYMSLGGGARYEVLLAGVGISATLDGRGAYATDRNLFNIEASATGTLHLGFLGSVDVVRYAGVVSSNGWGTCGNVYLFVKAGVGQDWDRNVELILGCDLGPFDADVPDPRGRAAQAGERTFTVDRGTKVVGVELTGAGPEPRVRIVDPKGRAVATVPTGRRAVGKHVAIIAPPGSATQAVFMRNPVPGRYRVQWGAGGPPVTRVRVARDVEPLSAKVAVERIKGRPGRRKLRVSGVKGLAAGERLVVGIRTPAGIRPVAEMGAGQAALSATMDELAPGVREIVGVVVRNGIPLPARTRTLGRYRAELPPAPRAVRAVRRGTSLRLRAVARRGAELPDRWQYVVRRGTRRVALVRGRPGRTVRVALPRGAGRVSVAVRPVVAGRALRGRPVVVRPRA